MSTATALDRIDEPDEQIGQRAELARLRAVESDLRARIDDIDQRLSIQLGLVVDLRMHAIDRLLADVERGEDAKPALDALRSYIDDELRPMSHWLSAASLPVSAVPVAVPSGVDDALTPAEVSAQIATVNDAISQLQQRLWVIRRRAGFALHGGFQGALHVVAMKLAAEASPSPEFVAGLRRDVQRAVARVTAPPASPPSLQNICADVAALWQGTCAITADIAPGAGDVHIRHPFTAECAAEVVLELAQNAVRHGRASQVRVRITGSDDRLMIEVADNGVWVDGKAGLGTQMLDDFCSAWSVECAKTGSFVGATLLLA